MIQPLRIALEELTFLPEPFLNHGLPVRVALVTASDEAPADMLQTITASYWFAHTRRIQLEHADLLHIHEWEIVPGQSPFTVHMDLLDPQNDALIAILFSDYNSPGPHRLTLSWEVHAFVVFGNSSASLKNSLQ